MPTAQPRTRGDLALGQPLEVEEDDGAGVLGELHERALDVLGDDLAQAIELGVVAEPLAAAARPRAGATVSSPPTMGSIRRRRQALIHVLRRIRKSQALRFVPGSNCDGAAQRARIRLLHEILGVGGVAGEVAREIEERVGVRERRLGPIEAERSVRGPRVASTHRIVARGPSGSLSASHGTVRGLLRWHR